MHLDTKKKLLRHYNRRNKNHTVGRTLEPLKKNQIFKEPRKESLTTNYFILSTYNGKNDLDIFLMQ